MFTHLKIKFFYIMIIFLLLNIHIVYCSTIPNMITNENGTIIYEYDMRADIYDENLEIVINDSNANNYIIEDKIKYDSELKKLKPDEYNNLIEELKLKYNELKLYSDNLYSFVNDTEKELILKYLPELLNDKIYFDVDYNDASIEDMYTIYNALIKIYDAVKITATPYVYTEHLGYDKYIYGYNIDFLRANIKSLKNALNRKEIFKIDKKSLQETKHNELLDELYYLDEYNGEEINTRYEVVKVSELIDDTYFNVVLEPKQHNNLYIGDIINEIRVNDVIKIIYNEYENALVCKNKNEVVSEYYEYDEYEFVDENGEKYYFYSGNQSLISLNDKNQFVVKIYKNAVCLTLHQYLINNYVADDKLEDKFYDNIKLTDNLFGNIDKIGIKVTHLDFDEKGYVKSLIDIRGMYE